ncbi:MAG TPA: hypothetical protein PLS70_06075, partial [Acidobacteriota bacterium]|nr:hypothetical protein [Acidobacteriota bacterium]HNB70686.1 hypothetical protein [Acidobacteriota bacterium]
MATSESAPPGWAVKTIVRLIPAGSGAGVRSIATGVNDTLVTGEPSRFLKFASAGIVNFNPGTRGVVTMVSCPGATGTSYWVSIAGRKNVYGTRFARLKIT